MRHSFWLSLLAFTVACTPLLAHAASTLTPIIPTTGACTCSGSAPDWGCVLATVQIVMNDLVAFATIIITIYIAWAGVGFLLSPTNSEGRTKARARITNAVLGLLIALAAWLFIDSLLKVIYNSSASAGSVSLGPWNSLLNDTTSGDSCIKKQSTPALPGLAGGSASQNANGGAAVTTTGSSSAAGSCTAPSGGDCSVSNLSTTCFGSNASQAAQICNKESANNPNNLSRSDVTSDGHSYSVGLFQINITNSFNQQVDGQNCSAAFSGPCQGKNVVQSGSTAGHCSVTVTNTQLYNDCVTAAENPTNNINAACSLNNDGNSGWSKWSTSSACNL